MIQFAGRRRRHINSTSITSLPPKGPKDVAAAVGFLFLKAWQKGTQLAGTSSFTPSHFAFSTPTQTPPLYSPSSLFSVFKITLSQLLSHVSLHLSSVLSSFSVVSSPLASSSLPISPSRSSAAEVECLHEGRGGVGAVDCLQKGKENVGGVESQEKGEKGAGVMSCLQKVLCETNHEGTQLGTLGKDLSEVLRLVSHLIFHSYTIFVMANYIRVSHLS